MWKDICCEETNEMANGRHLMNDLKLPLKLC